MGHGLRLACLAAGMVACSILAGCEGAATLPAGQGRVPDAPPAPRAHTSGTAAPPTDQAVAIDPQRLPDGPCGGFEKLPSAKEPASLLAGRLLLRPLEGMQDRARSHSIMSAATPNTLETRLLLSAGANGERKLVVVVEELFRRPGKDFAGAVRRLSPEAATANIGTLALGDISAMALLPSKLEADHEKALALRLYVVTPDDLVQLIRFYVSPEVAANGTGCSRLALKIASSLRAGGRRINLSGGPTDLPDALKLVLPPDFALVPQVGPDFVVYRGHVVTPLEGPNGGFNVYVGHHPQELTPGDKAQAPLFGRPVTWMDRREGNVHLRETIANHPRDPHLKVHVFFEADDESIFQRLIGIASSLR